MDPLVFVAGGLLVVFLVVVLPRWRDHYEERYEDERAFFRQQRPRLWGLIGGMADSADPDDQGREPGQCPVCGTDNEPVATFCRKCDRRLPTETE